MSVMQVLCVPNRVHTISRVAMPAIKALGHYAKQAEE